MEANILELMGVNLELIVEDKLEFGKVRPLGGDGVAAPDIFAGKDIGIELKETVLVRLEFGEELLFLGLTFSEGLEVVLLEIFGLIKGFLNPSDKSIGSTGDIFEGLLLIDPFSNPRFPGLR